MRLKYQTSDAIKCYHAIEIIIESIFNDNKLISKEYQGYWVDKRNTDHAWLENQVFTLNLDKIPNNIPPHVWKQFLILYLYSKTKGNSIKFHDTNLIKNKINSKLPNQNLNCLKSIIEHITDSEKPSFNKKTTKYRDFIEEVDKTQKIYDKVIDKSKSLTKLKKNLTHHLKNIKNESDALISDESSRENISCFLGCKDKEPNNIFKQGELCDYISD